MKHSRCQGWRSFDRSLIKVDQVVEYVVTTRSEVPPPSSASRELLAAIASRNVAERTREFIENVPVTAEEWRELQKSIAEKVASNLLDQVDSLPVRVERESVAEIDVYRIVPYQIAPSHRGHLFLHIHGGAFVLLGGCACYGEALVLALGAGVETLSIDYRMPPSFPYPAAVEDVAHVFRELIGERPPASIAMGGTSSGAATTMCVLQKLLAEKAEVPAAIFLGAPAADLTRTGDSLFLNEGVDSHSPTVRGLIEAAALLYTDGLDLADPRVSPIYGSFKGFPPALLVSGTRDISLSHTVRTHIALRQAETEADLLVYEGMSHADYVQVPESPESKHFVSEFDRFLSRHLSSDVG